MEPRSGCPINAAVEVLGDRWSLLVMRDVIFDDRLVRLVDAEILTRGRLAPRQRRAPEPTAAHAR